MASWLAGLFAALIVFGILASFYLRVLQRKTLRAFCDDIAAIADEMKRSLEMVQEQ